MTDPTQKAAGREEQPQLQNAPRTSAPAKTSYESNALVQRWLQDQTLEELQKQPFDPAILAGRRDRPWLLSALAHFYERDLIDDVIQVIKSGKEATVYCCTGGPAVDEALLAAKIYRPRMFRSLSNDAIYRESRAQRDERGRPVHGRRRRRDPHSDRGRAERITAWITDEFETQRLLHDAGADVPRPIAQVGNATLMEYIGDAAGVAPPLHQSDLPREEAQVLFERLLWNIELFLACNRIHGDLSAYNILYFDGRATIIDFAQAVDPRYNHDLYDLFARDIERTARYFARYGVSIDADAVARDLWTHYRGY